MSITILEALLNARSNFNHFPELGFRVFRLAQTQLNNVVILLEKGYAPNDLIEPLLEEYGDVEKVPDKKVDDGN